MVMVMISSLLEARLTNTSYQRRAPLAATHVRDQYHHACRHRARRELARQRFLRETVDEIA